MTKQAFTFLAAMLCPFPRCKRPAGHHGVHWDGRYHHNDPTSWMPLKRQRKDP